MRSLLVGTLDLGSSFGLGDSALKDEFRRPATSLGDVGVESPLGWGSTLDLAPEGPVVARWRSEALRQVPRLTGEGALGEQADHDGRRGSFEERVADVVAHHRVERCSVTVYALGVASVQLQFAQGVPATYCEALLTCFEFAGYTPQVSADLRRAAIEHRDLAARNPHGPLEDLTRRPEPEVRSDAAGYQESTQFAYFRHVVLAVDTGDKPAVETLVDNMTDDVTGVHFELHGCLHHSSGLFVFEARGLDDGAADSTMLRDSRRVLADIEVTHLFAGVCSAYATLVLDAIRSQVDAYGEDQPGHADPQRLNRLRAISLAVVNLTRYDLVSLTEEDKRYFELFEAEEKLHEKHNQISGGVDVLYNVQAAEEQDASRRRSDLINVVLLALTSLTLISVLADSYNFLGGQDQLLARVVLRAVVLALLLLLLGGVLTGLIRRLHNR